MSIATFGFQKLEIYSISKELVKIVYSYTGTMPDTERFALAQQMNRAAISIPSNIAEGTSRRTAKNKMHFINMAYGSLMELICQMEIALDLKYITPDNFKHFSGYCKNLSIKLSNYNEAIRKSKPVLKEKTI